MPIDPAKLAPAGVRTLAPYIPGKPLEELEREYGISDSIKLASNENPLGPGPRALAAVAQASRQIRDGGLASVSVGAIMKSVGLTHGGFYGHFESREALLAEALERAFERTKIERLVPPANELLHVGPRVLVEKAMEEKTLLRRCQREQPCRAFSCCGKTLHLRNA